MKTAGQLLKQARVKKKLGLTQVAKITKIRYEFLEALERDDYSQLPSVTSTRGFVKNYAEFLGLSSDIILAIFRRDFSEKKISRLAFQKKVRSGRDFKFFWTPKTTSLAIFVVFISLFLIYLVWQYFSLINAPYY